MAPPMIAPSQGAHLVLDREFLPGDTAVLIPRTDDGRVLTGECWLSGAYRGTQEPANLMVAFVLTLRGSSVERADATIDPRSLDRLREARLRP